MKVTIRTGILRNPVSSKTKRNARAGSKPDAEGDGKERILININKHKANASGCSECNSFLQIFDRSDALANEKAPTCNVGASFFIFILLVTFYFRWLNQRVQVNYS